MSDNRVIIIGGGIGGLSAATALRHAGIDVALFEQQDAIRDIGAGVGLQVGARKALDTMGMTEKVASISGEPHRQLELKNSRGKVLAPVPQDAVTVYRGDLLDLLSRPLLEDETIRLNARAVSFDEDDAGVTVRFEDGSEERGKVLVGADGLKSTIRTPLLGAADPRWSGFTVWRAIPTFEHPKIRHGISEQAAGRGRIFGMFPSSDGRVYWFASATAPPGEKPPDGRHHEQLLRLFGDWYEPVPDIIKATDEAEIARNDIYDREPADRWGTGRVTLLGDAAHAMLPTLGQGAGQAIEDSAVLAHRLSRADRSDRAAVDRALRSYEERRRPRTAKFAKDSWRIAQTYKWSNPVLVWGRDTSLRFTPRRVWAKEAEEEAGYDVIGAT